MSEHQDIQARVDRIAEKHRANAQEGRQSLIGLRQTLQRSLPELQKAMPRTMIADQFVRVLLTTLQSTPAIAHCDPRSIIRSAFEAAALGLLIDGVLGHAYLVPFKQIAQLLIGYRGFCELAYRSGRIARIDAQVVCENDLFEYEDGAAPKLRFQKNLRGDRGAPYAAFALACWTIPHVPPSFEVLTADEIEARRRRSKSAAKETSPWKTDPEAMWRKSAIRALAKALPQSPDLTRAALVDELRETQTTVSTSHLSGIAAIEEETLALSDANSEVA